MPLQIGVCSGIYFLTKMYQVMSLKIKHFLLLICLFFLSGAAYSQEYKAAAGLRLGYPFSASVKYFATETNAFEAYVGTRGFGFYRWYSVSGAYLRHFPVEGVEGLQYYFGGGASMLFWNFDIISAAPKTTFGIQAYAGLDYKIPNAPVSVTIDWVPTYFLTGFSSGFGGRYGALGIRYILAE
jgi:hypothetical protein